jgi:hypothetical protein
VPSYRPIQGGDLFGELSSRLASVDRQLLEAAGAAALELAGKILVRWS